MYRSHSGCCEANRSAILFASKTFPKLPVSRTALSSAFILPSSRLRLRCTVLSYRICRYSHQRFFRILDNCLDIKCATFGFPQNSFDLIIAVMIRRFVIGILDSLRNGRTSIQFVYPTFFSLTLFDAETARMGKSSSYGFSIC